MYNVRFVLIFVMAALLGGCVSPAVRESNGAFTTPSPSRDEGELLVKVIHLQRPSVTHSKWSKLTLKEVGGDRQVVLDDSSPGAAAYSLFMGPVVPGRYQIVGFSNAGVGPANLGIIVAALSEVLTSSQGRTQGDQTTFTVKAGSLTNLGIIVSANPRAPGGQLAKVVLADEASLQAALNDAAPSALPRLSGSARSGWDQPFDASTAQRGLEALRPLAKGSSSLVLGRDDRLMYGAPLGMIHVRGRDGTWSTLRTGTLDSITSLAELGDRTLIAGTDSGKLLTWSPQRGLWTSQVVAIGECISQIEALGEHGYALITRASVPPLDFNSTYRVLFKQTLSDPGPLTELMQGTSHPFYPPTMYFDGTELNAFLNVPGIARSSTMLRFNPRTGEKSTVEQDFWAWRFYRVTDDLHVRVRFNGVGFYSDFSADGRSWEKQNRSTPGHARFTSRTAGYGISLVSMGLTTGTVTLTKTSDGGSTWKPTGTPFEVKRSGMVYAIGTQYFIDSGSDLLSTSDQGMTWKVEHPLTVPD